MKVSIITPLHNKGGYLTQTIKSVQAQTLQNWEMIIVDNRSSDEGPRVAADFARQEPRVRLDPCSRQGPGAARNHGLRQACGDWVLFLDADDLIEPDYLERRLQSLASVPDADLIPGPWTTFLDNRPHQRTINFPSAWKGSTADVLDSAIGFAPWAVHAALIRRAWLTGERCWQESFDCLSSEDNVFWFRVLHGSRIAWNNCPGALYRLATEHNRDTQGAGHRRADLLESITRHHLDYLNSLGLAPTRRQCLTLMRVWENTYHRAIAGGWEASSQKALGHATLWLRSCPVASPAILLRQVLGIRGFHQLQKIVRRPS